MFKNSDLKFKKKKKKTTWFHNCQGQRGIPLCDYRKDRKINKILKFTSLLDNIIKETMFLRSTYSGETQQNIFLYITVHFLRLGIKNNFCIPSSCLKCLSGQILLGRITSLAIASLVTLVCRPSTLEALGRRVYSRSRRILS